MKSVFSGMIENKLCYENNGADPLDDRLYRKLQPDLLIIWSIITIYYEKHDYYYFDLYLN